MNSWSTSGRLLVVLAVTAVAVLLAGCATGASPTPVPTAPASTSLPSAVVVAPSPTATGTEAPEATPAVVETVGITYESANPRLVPGVLDVYAPARAGPWPVVVMLPPPGDNTGLIVPARRVADLGFVVFAPSFGQVPAGIAPFTYDGFLANNSQAACAVEFARAHAAEYGGDPSTLIVFGHSGGANVAAMVAFARPAPSAGCLAGTTLGAIDADPRILDAITPWKHLAEHQDLKVVMLVSEDPGVIFEREVGDPWAPDSWLAVRDPSGDLRRRLEAHGAFADGTLDFVEVQQLLYSVLEAQGNPVSIDTMQQSTHDHLSEAGWPIFLAAFPKAAAAP